MTKWRSAWKPDHPIYRRLSAGTKIFLDESGQDILDWLWDSNRLIDSFKADSSYSDYSFTIAPAYKALEKWLLLLARFLGVPSDIIQKAQESGRLGLFLADDKVDTFFDSILEKLTLEADKKQELKTFVQTLRSTLKNFRHNPAHCGTIIEDVLRAESDFLTLLNTMDNITQSLIDASVIPFGGHKADPAISQAQMEERRRLASL
jgi:hypothetical protein